MPRKAEKSEKPKKRVSERRTKKKQETIEDDAETENTQNATLTTVTVEEPKIEPIIIEEKKEEIPCVPEIEQNKQIEKPRIRAPENKQTSHGNPNCFVHVTNLVRPYMIPDLKQMLSTVGNFDPNLFWIDSIKSNCYAKFSSVDEAVNAIQKLNGMKWPEESKKLLQADFANPYKMYTDTNKLLGEPSPEPTDTQKNIELLKTEDKELNGTEPPKLLTETLPLDKLFKTTKTTPMLYWSPLSETQIIEREALKLKLINEKVEETKV